jgi:hypothetical protein
MENMCICARVFINGLFFFIKPSEPKFDCKPNPNLSSGLEEPAGIWQVLIDIYLGFTIQKNVRLVNQSILNSSDLGQHALARIAKTKKKIRCKNLRRNFFRIKVSSIVYYECEVSIHTFDFSQNKKIIKLVWITNSLNVTLRYDTHDHPDFGPHITFFSSSIKILPTTDRSFTWPIWFFSPSEPS